MSETTQSRMGDGQNVKYFESLLDKRDNLEAQLDEANKEILHEREEFKQNGLLKTFKIEFLCYSSSEKLEETIQGVNEDDAQRLWLEGMNPEMNRDLNCWDIKEVDG